MPLVRVTQPHSASLSLTQFRPPSAPNLGQPHAASATYQSCSGWLGRSVPPLESSPIVSSAQASAPSGFTEAGAVRVWGGPAAYSGLTTRGDFVIFEGGPAYRYQSVMVARVPVF